MVVILLVDLQSYLGTLQSLVKQLQMLLGLRKDSFLSRKFNLGCLLLASYLLLDLYFLALILQTWHQHHKLALNPFHLSESSYLLFCQKSI